MHGKKKLTAFMTNDIVEDFKWKNFGNHVFHCELESAPIGNNFAIEIGGDINNYYFKILNKKCQKLEDLNNSVKPIFFQVINAWYYKIMLCETIHSSARQIKDFNRAV